MMPTMRASSACWENYMRATALARERVKRADEARRERAAAEAGCFWAPCPKCGEWFGGNERPMGGSAHLSHDARSGRICCPQCPGQWVATFEPMRSRP